MKNKTKLPVLRGLARNTILEHPYGPIIVVFFCFLITGMLNCTAFSPEKITLPDIRSFLS